MYGCISGTCMCLHLRHMRQHIICWSLIQCEMKRAYNRMHMFVVCIHVLLCAYTCGIDLALYDKTVHYTTIHCDIAWSMLPFMACCILSARRMPPKALLSLMESPAALEALCTAATCVSALVLRDVQPKHVLLVSFRPRNPESDFLGSRL